MSKTFCCCIPVRAAVFFFSLLTLLSSGAVAAITWYILHLILSGQVLNDFNWGAIDSKGRIIVGVAGGIFTFLALVSLAGFIGSVVRARKLVRIYSVFTWIYVIVSLVGAGFFYYLMYSGRNLYNDCHFKDSNGNEHECRVTFKTWQKIVYSIVVTIHLLIQIYIASVIGRYVDQLNEEHSWSSEYKLAKPSGASASTYQPTYYPPQAQEAHQGLLNPSGNYPYTDQSNAFGHRSNA